MSEQAGLLRAICEQPDDDAPRLVYADWLDDHGQPEQANYIRTQIALAQVPEHDALHIRRSRHWRDRNAAPDAAPPQPPLPAGLRWPSFAYRRGFPWKIEALNLGVLLREAPRLLELAPIQALDIDARNHPDLAPLAASPWLQRIVRLEFVLGAFDAKAIQKLIASPHLGRLTELVFAFGAIRSDGLRALLTAPLAGRLRVLGLRSNFFAEHGRPLGEAFAAAPLPALESLDLSGNRVSPPALRPLLQRGLTPALRELNLSGNALPGSPFLDLASAALPRLETLRLAKTEPRPAGVAVLVAAPFASCLRSLDLASNRLGPVAVKHLARAAALSGLRVLDLGNDSVGDSGAAALARSPHLHGLLSLDLRRAGLTDKGARALLDAPGLAGLILLDLYENTLSPAVVEEVRRRFGQFSASPPAGSS
jgi:uncharacterized protein (TIGR02996 family)